MYVKYLKSKISSIAAYYTLLNNEKYIDLSIFFISLIVNNNFSGRSSCVWVS